MIKEKVIAALSEPSKANTLEEKELAEIIAHAPYFAPALLWICQSKHKTGSLDYESFLTKAAAVTLDREHLYNLIYKQPLRNKIEAVQELANEEAIIPTPDQEVVSPVESTKVIEEEPTEANVTEGIPLTRVGDKTRRPEELDELELEILRQAAIAAPVLDDSSIEPTPLSAKPSETETASEHDSAAKIHPNKRLFTEWLKVIDGEPLNKKVKTAQPKKTNTDDLINRFIAQEPQISKSSKSEFFKPSKMAKLSLVENDDFVTETLANIYEQQGNKQKAITIYKKLMLTYPEKKNYFAARILALTGNKKDKE